MAIFKIDDPQSFANVRVELWLNDAGDPMGTVVLSSRDRTVTNTSQDMPAEQAVAFAKSEADNRGVDVVVQDPGSLWTVGWGELVGASKG